MKTLFAIIVLASLAACAGSYQPGGDHSLATADQTMGPRNHGAATRGIISPPDSYAPDNHF